MMWRALTIVFRKQDPMPIDPKGVPRPLVYWFNVLGLVVSLCASLGLQIWYCSPIWKVAASGQDFAKSNRGFPVLESSRPRTVIRRLDDQHIALIEAIAMPENYHWATDYLRLRHIDVRTGDVVLEKELDAGTLYPSKNDAYRTATNEMYVTADQIIFKTRFRKPGIDEFQGQLLAFDLSGNLKNQIPVNARLEFRAVTSDGRWLLPLFSDRTFYKFKSPEIRWIRTTFPYGGMFHVVPDSPYVLFINYPVDNLDVKIQLFDLEHDRVLDQRVLTRLTTLRGLGQWFDPEQGEYVFTQRVSENPFKYRPVFESKVIELNGRKRLVLSVRIPKVEQQGTTTVCQPEEFRLVDINEGKIVFDPAPAEVFCQYYPSRGVDRKLIMPTTGGFTMRETTFDAEGGAVDPFCTGFNNVNLRFVSNLMRRLSGAGKKHVEVNSRFGSHFSLLVPAESHVEMFDESRLIICTREYCEMRWILPIPSYAWHLLLTTTFFVSWLFVRTRRLFSARWSRIGRAS